MAPTVIAPAPASIAFSATIPERSIKTSGAASRCFMVGNSDMPPAMGRLSFSLDISATASETEFGL